MNWHKLLVPNISLAEHFLRGTIVYLALFSLLRFLPNRQVGAVGVTDLLVVILFANAAQNAMATDYTSITDGLILIGTIIFWSYLLNWLGYRFPSFQRLLTSSPLLLVKNGRMIYRNMRRELITESELRLQLRKQGIEKIEDVKKAFIEPDGNISVIADSAKGQPLSRPRAG
ncbi:MAG TPA: YetF domain-containing protein [Microcoleaceae cyanobacterium]